MPGAWRTVALFMDQTTAVAAQERLRQSGIESHRVVERPEESDAGYGISIDSIRLLVRDWDLERSEAILSENEYDALDEIDWGAPEPDAPHSAINLPVISILPSYNDHYHRVEWWVIRAFQLALIGLVFFPPLLHLVSVGLLFRVAFQDVRLSQAMMMKFYATLAINLTAIVLLSWVYLHLLRIYGWLA
jgi:hypothetical protein